MVTEEQEYTWGELIVRAILNADDAMLKQRDILRELQSDGFSIDRKSLAVYIHNMTKSKVLYTKKIKGQPTLYGFKINKKTWKR